MLETSTLKTVFMGRPGGRRRRGWPRKRWLNDLEDDLCRLGVRRWRPSAEAVSYTHLDVYKRQL